MVIKKSIIKKFFSTTPGNKTVNMKEKALYFKPAFYWDERYMAYLGKCTIAACQCVVITMEVPQAVK